MISVEIKSVDIINVNPPFRILSNISFKLTKGNIYTVLGKNGSGKTTLVNAISKLLDNTIYKINADVKFNNIPIFEIDDNELIRIRKEKIRYVFQDSINCFDPLRKIEYFFNILNIDEEECSNLLEYFLLPSKKKLFELYPYELSGGMAQRVAICLALLSKPQLLILDEPTSSIDISITNLLSSKLREFVNNSESAVLLITQDLEFAEHVSNYLAYLKNGSLTDFVETSNYIKTSNRFKSELF